MKKLGLTADDLFEIGISEYAAAYGESFDEELHFKMLKMLGNDEAAKDRQAKEAVLRAVAKMIEVNNAVLLAEIKKLVSLRNQALS